MALHLSNYQRDTENHSKLFSLVVVLLLLFGILLTRVWYLQIFHGRKWRVFSEANRVEIKRSPPIRGRIMDRNGYVISESRPSFDIVLKPSKMGNFPEDVVDRLMQHMNIKEVNAAELYLQMESSTANESIVMMKDIDRRQLATFMAHQYLFPGVEVVVTPARNYPLGKHGSHFLGYLGEISKKELKSLPEDTPYQSGDVWGISGVEKTYEEVVRGVYGAAPIIVDAFGREIGQEFAKDLLPDFQHQEALPGDDLVLTVDSKLQEVIEEAFTFNSGAVVAMDPRNGDILALLSAPQFEPEKFVRGVSREYWEELQSDPKNPLYDRSLRGQYPPGSTFKIVTGLAALSEDVIKPSDKIYCPGYYKLGNETKKCWNHKGHGEVDFHKALVQSCDVYFYEVGKRLGVDRIAKYSHLLGLGRDTGIPINKEKAGLIPTEEWKKKRFGVKWVGGETLSVAIGQGFVSTTPIQLAVMLSTLVNDGITVEPRIALRQQTFDGEIKKTYSPKVKNTFTINTQAKDLIIKALDGVVNEPGGTAYWTGRSQTIKIGGKTGTAQVVSLKARVQLQDHAWFIGFAPVEKPEIVVVAIVEYGGHGGTTAAPIVKKAIEQYLLKHETRE